MTRPLYTVWQRYEMWAWYGVLVVGMVGLFVWMQPKVGAMWQTHTKRAQVEQLVASMFAETGLPAKEYWEWRERYSPGVLTFNHELIEIGETQSIVRLASGSSEIVWYHSPLVQSTDAIVDAELVEQKLVLPGRGHLSDQREDQIIVLTDHHQIYFEDDHTLKIHALESIEELMSANGLFNYTREERELLRDTWWYHQATIHIP